MSSPNQAPFPQLVDYLKRAFQSADPIRIPVEIVFAFQNSIQPLDDTGLRDLIKLFDGSHEQQRIRLDSTLLAQLVQIIFHLRPSLLQQKLLYSLLMPPQATDLGAFELWRISVSAKLIPTILRSIQGGALNETLLIAAAHSLALFVDGDEETKNCIYGEQGTLRRCLGIIVKDHDNYTVKIAVANLIREFLTGRSDRHLFWPQNIPEPFFSNFPLANFGHAEWLNNTTAFLSAATNPNAIGDDSAEVFVLQYSEREHTVAIISKHITLVLPATTQHPLDFIQLPLLDGMVCQCADDSAHEVIIRYRRATGYQISQGVKRASEEVRLVLSDQAQCISFAEAVRIRIVNRFADSHLALERKLVSQKTSYASVDLSPSRETSFESAEDSLNLEAIPGMAVSMVLPSRGQVPCKADVEVGQERTTRASRRFSQAQSNPHARFPFTSGSLKTPPNLQTTSKQIASSGHTNQKSTKSSIRAELSNNMKDSQRQLKRRRVKDGDAANRNDVDWNEDLRDDEIELEAPDAKKVKTTAQKGGEVKHAATAKAFLSKSQAANAQKKKNKAKVSRSRKIAITARTRRMTLAKSAEHVDESQSDLNDNDNDNDNDDERPGSVLQYSRPLTPKKPRLKKQEIHINDSQGQDQGDGVTQNKLDGNKNLLAEGSSSATPILAMKGQTAVQDDLASDSVPIDIKAKLQTVTRNDMSFGIKLALAMTAKAQLLTSVTKQPSRKSFGNVKEFVKTVNVTRNSLPQKSPVKELQSVRLGSDIPAIRQNTLSDQNPVEFIAQRPLIQVQATRPFESQPKSCMADHSPRQINEKGNVHVGRDKTASSTTLGEDTEQAVPTSIQNGTLEESARRESTPKDNRDRAALDATQLKYRGIAANASTEARVTDESNESEVHNTRNELLEIELSESTVTASRWLPSKPKSRERLEENSIGAEIQKLMDPLPVPRRSERRRILKAIGMLSDEDNSALVRIDERIQRKTPILSYGVHGPRNQDVVSPTKPPKVANTSALVPRDTGKHTTVQAQKKAVPPQPTPLPVFSTIINNGNCYSSDVIHDDEGVLVQDETAGESLAVGQTSELNNEEHIVAQEGSTVKISASVGTNSRRNALQSSKVDGNGSPRLCHRPQSPISPAKLEVTSTTSEQSESSVFASYELEKSASTDSSSPVLVRPEHLQQGVPQPQKANLTESRGSIGLEDVLSDRSPGAAKSINTAAFKKQIIRRPSGSAVVAEKRSTVMQKVQNVPQTKPSFHPQAVHVETRRASPLSSPRTLRSDSTTRIVRLGPTASADFLKVDETPSPTPASFNTCFKQTPIPSPPPAPPRYGKRDLKAAPAGEGKRKNGPTIEDEDLTLVDNEEYFGRRSVRKTTPHYRQQSSDCSTDSQSLSMPEEMHDRVGLRAENAESLSGEFRVTQKHVLSILHRAGTDVILRLQAAELAVQGKTNEYHLGCYTLIAKLETTYEACIQHERSRAAPRVAGLCESYNKTIDNCYKGLRRVRRGAEFGSLSEKIEKSRSSLFSLIEDQMEEAK